jgi:small membrane protein
MIAQVVLSLLLGTVLVYAWAEYKRSPIVAGLSFAVSLLGFYFVWIPSHATGVAELFGIGRGADLILYLWVCISLIVLLNLHLKLRTQHELLTTLARSIALASATVSAENAGHSGRSPASAVKEEQMP